MAIRGMMIFYKCDGKRCFGYVDCEPAFHAEHPGNPRERYASECQHTTIEYYAKNGPIKGPIDFLRRFRIRFRPYIHFVER